MEEDHNVVRLATFEHAYQAELLKTKLFDLGVPSWVTIDSDLWGISAAGLAGVQVNVRQIDFEFASEALEHLDSDEQGEPAPAWTCGCGEQVDEGFAICWSCGAEFSSNDEPE